MFAAALYGLQRNNHLRVQVESNIDKVQNRQDIMTGLYAFMVAAAGNHFDLRSIYELMRINLNIVSVL